MTRFVLILVTSVAVKAAVQVAPAVDDALNFSIPSDPRISPNGQDVVYRLSRTNWEKNAFESDLWLVRRGNPAVPLTTDKSWNGDPQWSPAGDRIAFISERTGRRQIFVTGAAGETPRKLTRTEDGVNAFRWAPDGKSIAFTTDENGDDPVDRKDLYGDFEVVKAKTTPTSLRRVWLDVSTVSGDARPGIEEFTALRKHSVGGFAWSPDGSKIAFEDRGIFVLDIAAGKVSAVATGAGPYRNPVWSPAGKDLAFETAGGDPGFYYSNWYVARAPAAGGVAQPVTKCFDENADLEAWTAHGIYFGALQRTAAHLFLADPASGAIRRVSEAGDSADTQFSVTPDGAKFAFIRGSSQGLPEVRTGLLDAASTQITDGSAQAAPFRFAVREIVSWKNPEGVEIEGVLYKPADFDPQKKYPLLVAIHGGPVAVDQSYIRPDRTYPLEEFVAKGALVLRPNYRGSAGYGAKLRSLAVRSLGTGDAEDILSGVDSLVARGFIDAARVGAMGWSEGGYISAFLATSTDRFRAVSVGAGISDWLTYYVNTDITPFTRQYLKATPWDDPEIYRKASPITYINRAKTPVLIQHGDQDRRVPIPNAYELRQALDDRKVPVKMIVYKGFGHSIDRPKQQRAVMEHNLEWFSEWILDPEPTSPPAPVTISQMPERSETGDLQ